MIEELIREYNDLGEKALKELETEDFLKLEDYLLERDKILEKIKNLEFSKEEFKHYAEKLEVLKQDKLLIEKIKQNRDIAKKELLKINKRRQMNNKYSKSVGNLSFVNIKM